MQDVQAFVALADPKAITCLQPPVTMPVSSRLGIVLEAALAAFHQIVPHISMSPSYKE